jgi:hypothetical protein
VRIGILSVLVLRTSVDAACPCSIAIVPIGP